MTGWNQRELSKHPDQTLSAWLGRFRIATGAKEILEKGRALFRQNAGYNIGAPVAGWLVKKATAIDHGAALLVARTKHEPPYTGVADRASAHGAGFQRDIEFQSSETVISPRRSGLAQGQYFRMCRRVMPGDGAVMGLPDNSVSGRIDDHRTDRRLSSISRSLRQA